MVVYPFVIEEESRHCALREVGISGCFFVMVYVALINYYLFIYLLLSRMRWVLVSP